MSRPRIYLDSCLIIYLIQAPDLVREPIRAALDSSDGEAPEVCISALSRLECRVKPLKDGNQELLAEFDRFFASRDLRRARLSRTVVDLATELRAEFGIRTPDALHLAAALAWDCQEFWTNDQRLPGRLSERIDIRNFP